ncbi:hypothetical protein [Ornithinimicrobium cryptoxanthini]|uniref:hypothetical protein n=1 Tax=Ornithinimicrobium cryptoxanthini TaxID=2934161 RepID=UPI002118E528|nr:hypothetical protein [Ornithinimicrobium cryptoxanthini]
MRRLDLSARTDLPVPVEVLSELVRRAANANVRVLLVGAAARDLVVHAPREVVAKRATEDVDVAIAVTGQGEIDEFVRGLNRVGRSEHKFLLFGLEVDVVPFGSIEKNRKITFPDDHELDVTGLMEASKTAVAVTLPGNVRIHVAALPAQAALKVLAWRDRRYTSTRKDASDLAEILLASSEGPYGEATWEDDESLDATDADIVAAGAYRTGRLAAEPFSDHDAGSVLAVLDDPPSREALVRDMRTVLATVLVEAFHAGFLTTVTRQRSNRDP